jgi:hypothetical protein
VRLLHGRGEVGAAHEEGVDAAGGCWPRAERAAEILAADFYLEAADINEALVDAAWRGESTKSPSGKHAADDPVTQREMEGRAGRTSYGCADDAVGAIRMLANSRSPMMM